MKHNYRIWDAVVQIMLLIIWIVAFFAKAKIWFYLYFIAGGWYIVSLVMHIFISNPTYKSIYIKLAILISLLISTVLLSFIIDFFSWAFLLLMIVSPLQAVFYTCICIAEIVHLRKRPLSYIK
jgi:hypothetical protein